MKTIIFVVCLIIQSILSFAQTNTFPSTGSVGIGTTNPQEALHVEGGQILNGNLTFGSDQATFFIKGPANGGAIRIRSNAYTTYDRNIQFGNIGNNGFWTSFMIVEQNGMVGIGTLVPEAKLEVAGNVRQNFSTGDNDGFSQYSASTPIFSMTRQTNNLSLSAFDGIGLAPGAINGPSKNYALYAAVNGNIGIGTINPTRKLTVLMDPSTNGEGVAVQAVNSGGAGSQPGYAFLNSSGSKRMYSYLDVFTDTYNIGNASGMPLMTFNQNGNVGIGTTDPKGYKLAVAGNVIAESIKVQLLSSWPDYVFEKDYQLPTLQETENHIKEKGYLPGIPSASEVKTNGIDLGEMNVKLLQKIEELTLYLIDKDKQVNNLQDDVNNLKLQIKKLLTKTNL